MNEARTVLFDPVDTLFFRDGRPFNQDDPGQAAARSQFPPAPPTLVGAIRAAIAEALGGFAKWNTDLLGDGVNWQNSSTSLGKLRFEGLYVVRGDEPLFPAPLCLVGKPEAGRNPDDPALESVERLTPPAAEEDLCCDLAADAGSHARLPRPIASIDGFKDISGWWLGRDAMKQVLQGATPVPQHFVSQHRLWKHEPRVGLARDTTTKTALEGMLYQSAHVRLMQRWKEKKKINGREEEIEHGPVRLAMMVNGLPQDSQPKPLASVGGEHRFAQITVEDGQVPLPSAPACLRTESGHVYYTVVAISPVDLGECWPGSLEMLDPNLPGTIVSACVGKPARVGGWDSRARRPLPLRPLVPAGSVWFMQADEGQAQAVLQQHGKAIGQATNWGFGRVLIGTFDCA